MGIEFCRFVCGTPDEQMDTHDGYYDGEWLWPRGLAHYVERHSVRLPDEFVQTMRSRSWQPPRDIELPARTRPVVLKRVGEWCDCHNPTLPDPRTLVQPNWCGYDLPCILASLREGGRSYLIDLLDYDEMPDPKEKFWVTSDLTFWTDWARRHSSPAQLAVPEGGAFVRREWLVRRTTVDGFLEWYLSRPSSPDGHGKRRYHHSSALRLQVDAALKTGGELWLWQHGDPRYEGGASGGLALVRDGQVHSE